MEEMDGEEKAKVTDGLLGIVSDDRIELFDSLGLFDLRMPLSDFLSPSNISNIPSVCSP